MDYSVTIKVLKEMHEEMDGWYKEKPCCFVVSKGDSENNNLPNLIDGFPVYINEDCQPNRAYFMREDDYSWALVLQQIKNV